MFRQYLTLFITLLTFSHCFGTLRSVGDTLRDCTTGVSGYCSDCDHSVLCNGDVIASETTCSTGQVCQEISTFSSCVDSLNVEACECPETGKTVLPDVYDDDKFIICDNGNRHIEECQENEFFNPDTEHCEPIPTTTPAPTTTPVTRSPSCPATGFDTVAVSCTQFQACYSDGTFSDVDSCPLGYVFNDETNNCDQYIPFTCVDKVDGYYSNTHNCSIYYLCISGSPFGSPFTCPAGKLFDDTAGTCLPEEEATCNAVQDCGICPDAETFIPYDCTYYYDCQENAEEGLPFIPVLSSCPEGSCFNENTTFCEI
ncbi:hypothetical protein Anas_07906 [Armadillidium nasatum]|uniref:Chitin-binding type-2 domain-containing protein n=1 Tax=Armadillidium nasatum TaxID=96803 RepID=A0A5N5SW81_9CRUS|nr:hypothetical protein Anas_07906 [Armadillidium nasatum]